MRLSLLFLVPLVVGAFFLGRATDPSGAATRSTGGIYTGHLGDVFRVPSAAARCLVTAEAGAPKLSCNHVPVARARYNVIFYKDNLFVFRYGNPDRPVFSARGRP